MILINYIYTPRISCLVFLLCVLFSDICFKVFESLFVNSNSLCCSVHSLLVSHHDRLIVPIDVLKDIYCFSVLERVCVRLG